MRIPIFTLSLSFELLSLALAIPSFDPPSGPHPVGVVPAHLLVDSSRQDLFAPSSPRRLLVSIYYPTVNSTTTTTSSSVEPLQYIPRSLANAIGGFFSVTYNITSRITLPFPSSPSPAHGLPLRLILFSPGAATSRLIYTTLITDLVSHGYTIVSIDHPYDGLAVEFPPTSGCSSSSSSSSSSSVETVYLTLAPITETLLEQRIADVAYVLRQLNKLPILRNQITNSTQVGMMGHSLGGATAAWTVNDRRNLSSSSSSSSYDIVGGMNLDGTLFTPTDRAGQVIKGLTRPFLLMGVKNHTNVEEPTWTDSLGEQVSKVVLKEGAHMSFSDLAEVVEMEDGGPGVSTVIKEFMRGTLEGRRTRQVVGKVVLGFWDWVLGNGTEAGFKAAVDGVSEEVGWMA